MANVGHADEFVHLPVPEDDSPVGLPRQRNYLISVLVVGAEGRGDKLLRRVDGQVVQILGQRLLILAIGDFEDRKFALFALWSPLTHAQVLAILGQRNVRNGFHTFLSC